MVSQTLILVSLVGLFVTFLGQRVARDIRRRLLAAKHGCAPAARWLTWDPIFGSDIPLKIVAWNKAGNRTRAMAKIAYERNHTARSHVRGVNWIWTTDPMNVKAVLATDSTSYGLSFRADTNIIKLMGRGTFNVDGERWMHTRQMVKPTFNRAHLTDAGIKKHFDLLLTQLPRDGSTIQAADLFGRMGTDVGSEFIFGESTHTLRSEHGQQGVDFNEAFTYANVGLIRRSMLGRWAIFSGHDPKVEEAIKTVHQFVDDRIEQAARRKEKLGDRSDGERNILVYNLLDVFEDRVSLRYELLHLFLGANETIGIVMTNILFLAARNPHVWTRLREEVKDVREDELSFEKLKSLTYVQWTIKEALRLYPPAPTSSREVTKPTTLPAGGGPDASKPVALLPGDRVALNWVGIHRRRDIYGEDAEEFKPERWEHLRTTFEYQAFSGGPRVCPGQQVALYWLAYTLTRLALEVKEVKNRDERLDFVEDTGLSVKSRYGAKVAFVWA